MYRTKQYRTLRGYTIIYIMFFGILCMTMILIGFKLELGHRKNVFNDISSRLRQEDNLKYREFLFTLFHKKIIELGVSEDLQSVRKYVGENHADFKVVYQNAALKYDNVHDLFILTYPYDNYHLQIETFKLDIKDSKFNFLLETSKVEKLQ